MSAAATDTVLQFLYDAIWRLRMNRGKGLSIADIAAIGVLEDACRRVLKGDAQ